MTLWSPQGLMHEVMVVPREGFVPNPDTQVHARPGWHQLVTPSFRSGGLNAIDLCALPSGEVDAAIDETLALYAGLGLRFRWTVGPDSAPADLAERLERRGLKRGALVGLYREVAPAAEVGSDDVEIIEVTTATVAAFTEVMAEGWGVEPGPLAAYNRLVVGQRATQRLFLAKCDGQPVGTAGLALFERSVYLVGGVVLPEFRRRGVYRALTLARLALARALGKTLATCQARETTAAPLLEKLEFQRVGRFSVFTNE